MSKVIIVPEYAPVRAFCGNCKNHHVGPNAVRLCYIEDGLEPPACEPDVRLNSLPYPLPPKQTPGSMTVALSCAKGIRQKETVNILLEYGKIRIDEKVVYLRGGSHPIQVLASGQDWSSWRSLRKRLLEAGFKTQYRKEDGFKYIHLVLGEKDE